jgi:hypothetical protein
MNPHTRVFAAIWDKLRFFATCGSDSVWHVQAYQLATQLSVPEHYVREALVTLSKWGFISLKTWSNRAWREISFPECSTEKFFRNGDDASHVRVKSLLSF